MKRAPNIPFRLLLLAASIGAWPGFANAQWATSKTEHDWRLTIGESSYGLVQTAVYMSSTEHEDYRTTTIHLGPWSTSTTRFRAPQIAGAALFLLVVAGVGCVFAVRRASRGSRTP